MIKLHNLSKSYQGKTIFNNLNIVFEKNNLNFILGKNGCGKTTLFKCILGLEEYEGDIIFEGESVFCVYDDTPFYLNLNGFKNIELFKALYKVDKNKPIGEFLLDKEVLNRKVSKYSYGQRKKLAMMIIELINPDVLILDEISNGLDYETISYLKKKFFDWKKSRTIIISGHQLDFYNDIVDDVYIMKDNSLLLFEDNKENLGDLYEEYIR